MAGHHPSFHARINAAHPAIILADSGEQLSYAELDAASNQVAHLLRSYGLKAGDGAAMMLSNQLSFPIVYWGATRAGLMLTLLPAHLQAEEAAYILQDCGAKALFLMTAKGDTAAELQHRRAELIPNIDLLVNSEQSLSAHMAAWPTVPIADEISGFHQLYSSGTTGRPKGVVMPFTPGPIDEYNVGEGSPRLYENFQPLVTLNAGPLYHGAPLSAMIMTQRLGGTFVTQRKFDAEGLLQAIQHYRVTNAQFVPTMFIRLLALPDAVRQRYDLSSLRIAIHAAAPCPVEVKRQMIDWFGPIILEYYGSSEGVGATAITSAEWLKKPGSVGKSSLGPIHICADDGRELAADEIGLIYFELVAGRGLNYRGDPEKTKKAQHPQYENWVTVGDIGRLDGEGYLYLTDRKDFMIISGGVNIYPQAIEDALILHPKVMDVAVIGQENAEYGEQVLAVVQPKNWADVASGLEGELRAWCADKISPVTQPRAYQFIAELPRLESGKIAKHALKALISGN